ncbi:hypothetical protein Pla8534_01710 [Lignipirellula cremea]|uniref:Leucine Rich repeats (2 copies) n=2 Tax=Lignipirellula cremea TaxID=2528010 RepID=A0A518DKQ8_9BACT|nr:hypothetical protein Pla8534_01710 [Lignipirellula cremea]
MLLASVFGEQLQAEDLPVHPDDLKIVRRIAAHEKLDALPVPAPRGWPQVEAPVTVRFAGAGDRSRHALTVGCNEDGRVTHLVGNGPLLCNEAFAWIAGMPELRVIRIDHNIPRPQSGVDHQLYDGSGLIALKDSKLEEIKIGHAFDDDGMAALAELTSLRVAWIGHSRATDAGIAHLAAHPRLEQFKISSQGRPNCVTEKCLATLATLPKLRRLGLQETFVTYEGGLKHLAKLTGQLEFVSLKMTLVLPADVEKLKADHPGLEVETSTPAEILENPNARGVARWASPAAVKYLQSRSAE